MRGMSCASCEERIRRAVEALDGVVACVAEYASSRVRVSYDPDRVDGARIAGAIREAGYEIEAPAPLAGSSSGPRRLIGGFTPIALAGIGVLLLGLLLGLRATGVFSAVPEVTAGIGYGLVFVIGLFTSLHCVAMCGAIGLSQSVSAEGAGGSAARRPAPGLLYNAGRVVAYTVIGGIVGALGAVIGFSRALQGGIVGVAGVFMVIMGVTMLDLFPSLRKLVPRMPLGFRRLAGRAGSSRPFVVGLLNGLMPCGPLQSMQIYALGTGSAAAGALSMFLFSLGTVPLMLGFGAVASLFSRRLQAKVIGVSALLVALLGMGMVARAMNLTGASARVGSAVSGLFRPREAAGGSVATIRNGVQYVQTTLHASSYDPIVVQAGVLLRWTVKAASASINGCNSPMTVPSWGIEKRLVPGDNVIEFVPTTAGDVTYTCWMGMIASVIRVVPSLAGLGTGGAVAATATGASAVQSGSCCGSGSVAESTASASCCGGGGSADGAAPFGGGLIVKGPLDIPTEGIAVASTADGVQRIAVEAGSDGFSPAILVMQRGVPVVWELRVASGAKKSVVVDVPAYDAHIDLGLDGAAVRLTPDADFTLSTADDLHHAYVKVVDDLETVDQDALRKEVRAFVAGRSATVAAARLPAAGR